MEKARTVPDTYPLSLNLVVTGCNQKTSREPVMNVSDAEAQTALDDLRRSSLVIESHGSRVAVRAQPAARAGRARAVGRAAGPADAARAADRGRAAPERRALAPLRRHLLGRGLSGRAGRAAPNKGGPLVVRLPRAPGAREERWAHLLSGPVARNKIAAGALQESAGRRFDRHIQAHRARWKPRWPPCAPPWPACAPSWACHLPDPNPAPNMLKPPTDKET
jgi:hypothetical protein